MRQNAPGVDFNASVSAAVDVPVLCISGSFQYVLRAMQHLLTVYVHLVATCVAIGIIFMADMRLLFKLIGYRVVIPRPERLETRLITSAITMLLLSGCLLIAEGVAVDPRYLDNPKLQAKLLLVGLLCANALALHQITFPRLASGKTVARWSAIDLLCVALPVGLSNTLWLYCAFLGIARAWNFSVSVVEVLSLAGALFMFVLTAILLCLRFAARDEPRPKPDWIDGMKLSLCNLAPLAEAGQSSSTRRGG